MCQIKSQRRVISSTLRNSSVVRVSSPDFASGSLPICARCFVLGYRRKFASCVEATGPDSSKPASGDEPEDALQSTIEKSKKVLDMQRNLLQQIAERRKLVSSIKESTPNLDDGKASFKEEYGSSVNATKKEKLDGDANGSVSSNSYGKSSLKTEEYMETREEKILEEASSETDEPGRDEEKPPPLAGANVMNVILVAAVFSIFQNR